MPRKMMSAKILVPVVGVVVLVAVLLVMGFFVKAWIGLPPRVLGFGEGPDQPIAFPHTVHVQEAGISCQFCHRTVAEAPEAGIPSVQQCMFCHKAIGGRTPAAQAEIAKLRRFAETGQPINWVRVHRMPDHVQFVHEPHIRYFTQQKGMETAQVCSLCHGDVGSMTKVRQVHRLNMAGCVDCHRENNAPTDCAVCHY